MLSEMTGPLIVDLSRALAGLHAAMMLTGSAVERLVLTWSPPLISICSSRSVNWQPTCDRALSCDDPDTAHGRQGSLSSLSALPCAMASFDSSVRSACSRNVAASSLPMKG